MNRIWCLKIVILVLLVSGTAFADETRLGGCAYPVKYVDGTLAGFAAGPKEQTFQDAYESTLTLPIDEQRFLELLKAHHLAFDVYAEGKDVVCRDPPQWKSFIDRAIVKTYFITDRSKTTGGHGVHFAAYVNAAKKVVYIENRFTYEGP